MGDSTIIKKIVLVFSLDQVGGAGEPAQVPVPGPRRQQDRQVPAMRDDRRRYTHQGSLG